MCGYADRFRHLPSQRCVPGHDCASGYRTTFEDFGANSALGRIAVSWRAHFRARTAYALLIPLILPAQAGSGVQCVPHLAESTRAERKIHWAAFAQTFQSGVFG